MQRRLERVRVTADRDDGSISASPSHARLPMTSAQMLVVATITGVSAVRARAARGVVATRRRGRDQPRRERECGAVPSLHCGLPGEPPVDRMPKLYWESFPQPRRHDRRHNDQRGGPAAPKGPNWRGCAAASVRFGDVLALAPTDLTVRASTSMALVGANGSGKSTLLKLLAGLISPSEGRVERADGVGVAFVAQQHGHHRWLPLMVDEVLRMGTYRGRPLVQRIRSDQRAEIDAIADRLEVGDLRRRAFGELSGGQRQRVLVAQALIGSPRLLLLDEPITGLDLASQQRILTVIGEEVAGGSAVVYSTHHLEEAPPRRAGRPPRRRGGRRRLAVRRPARRSAGARVRWAGAPHRRPGRCSSTTTGTASTTGATTPTSTARTICPPLSRRSVSR